MSKEKQSSIDWLINQLQKSKDFHRVLNEVSQMSTAQIDIIGQAKAMHKEEMDKVAGDFWNEGASYMYDGKHKYNSFEEYYKETFGGQDNE